jgi:hypothetical protein
MRQQLKDQVVHKKSVNVTIIQINIVDFEPDIGLLMTIYTN